VAGMDDKSSHRVRAHNASVLVRSYEKIEPSELLSCPGVVRGESLRHMRKQLKLRGIYESRGGIYDIR
jgi:hypothetical protein